MKTKKPEPVAYLYTYHCDLCGCEWNTTEEYDGAGTCGNCDTDTGGAIRTVPLFEEEPCAIHCLRRIVTTWTGDSQTHADAVNAGRELVEGWDEAAVEEAANVDQGGMPAITQANYNAATGT